LATIVKMIAPAIRSGAELSVNATTIAAAMTRALTLMSLVVKIQLAWKCASLERTRRNTTSVAMLPASARSETTIIGLTSGSASLLMNLRTTSPSPMTARPNWR